MAINIADPEEISVFAREVPRFDAEEDPEGLKQYFAENGYVVVKEVANSEEIAHAIDLAWNYLEGVGLGTRRGQIETWETHLWPVNAFAGIAASHGIGQSEFLWYLRGLPPVKRAFALLWDTDDLIVSFDGGNFFRPWATKPEWRTMGGWYHVDQNAKAHPGLQTIQGLVTLTPVSASTGGFVCLPGSHKSHSDLCERAKCTETSKDFVPVPQGDPILSEYSAILPCVQAGDTILWDSRLVHCNAPGIALPSESAPEESGFGSLSRRFSKLWRSKKNEERPELLRVVGYICMVPRSTASEEVLEQRRTAFEKQITTTHWPNQFRITSVGREAPLHTFTLSPEQQALI